MVKRPNKGEEKEIALENINKLFSMAQKSKKFSKRYVELALKTSQRYKVKLPAEYKKSFCKHCYTLFNASNARYRIGKSKITITCLNCNKQLRMPYLREKKLKKSK
jgi:RNase P subunit RPR2